MNTIERNLLMPLPLVSGISLKINEQQEAWLDVMAIDLGVSKAYLIRKLIDAAMANDELEIK